MKKLITFLTLLALPSVLLAQGIKFEEGTYAEALAKAKAENKMLFLDVYTTWCGPCKMMAKNLFPTKEAGDKYNTNFVNYKIDAEQGEGLDVAEKFAVRAYPTNIFVDPKTGDEVYRVTGAGDLKHFLSNADIAVAEYNDPMKWEGYQAKLKAGAKDQAFLYSYLQKAKRLDKNNDEALDLYVSKYMNTRKLSDADLKFLVENITTLDNNQFAVLEKNSARINKIYDNTPFTFKNLAITLIRGTVVKLGKIGDETKFNKVLAPIVHKYSKTPESDMLFYTEKFYEEGKDEPKLRNFQYKKANILLAKTNAELAKEDATRKADMIEDIKMQLKEANIPVSQHQAKIDEVIKGNPSITKAATFNAASDLNKIAWGVYEANNTSRLAEALKWSARANELFKNEPGALSASMDTYAHLLYINGQKELAIQKQKEAIEIIKQSGSDENLSTFEEELQKMQEGKL